VCGGGALVSEPKSDYGDVDPRLKKVHRR